MNSVSSNSMTDRVLDELARALNAAYRDISVWVSRLDDIEKLFFICGFILLLFMLILVKAASRPKVPSRRRSFFTSLVLVMVFAFGAGWIIDSRLDFADYF